jgi:Ca2+-binding RTX toxin-like protein
MPTIATDLERLMLDLVNAERAEKGLPRLRLEQHLNQSADAHSAWMLATDTFSHTGEGGSSATDRIRAGGYDLVAPYGTRENLALTPADGGDGYADEVRASHQNLMNSPSHRANILDPSVTHIGIGLAMGEYSGQHFLATTQKFGYTTGDALIDHGADGPLVLRGTAGDDRIEGGAFADRIDAGRGHDTISGERGNDQIRGGGGNDRISGNQGFDTLDGGAGNDTIKGFFGDDVIYGGSGHDRIFSGANDDTVEGGLGRDKVYMGPGRDVYIDNGQEGAAGADDVRGGTGGDEIRGGGGDDQFRGGGGHDTVSGGSGDDLVVGHQGHDVLAGDSGNDTLYGNFGQDTFVFSEGDDVDRIVDYTTGWDGLRLDRTLLDGVDVETFLARNASVENGTTTIDFGGGDRLILDGVSDPSALAEDVMLF